MGVPSFSAFRSNINSPGVVDVNLKGGNNTNINLQGITNVLWEKVGNNPANCGEIGDTNGFTNGISYNGYSCSTRLKITAINHCGSTTIYSTIIGSYRPGGPLRIAQNSTNLFKIYPNPSKDIVNIDLRDQENQPKTDTPITGELFDMMGISVSKVQIKDNQATFSVQGLRKGIYVLKIYIDDQTETHQIAVE